MWNQGREMPIDGWLDYMNGMKVFNDEVIRLHVNEPKYQNEIDATKEILKIITNK